MKLKTKVQVTRQENWKWNRLKRVLFTLFMIGLFQIGLNIALPTIVQIKDTEITTSTLRQLMLLMSGNSTGGFSLFGLGITPFITATILMQLLVKGGSKYYENLSKQGLVGEQKIKKHTVVLTGVFATLQGISIVLNEELAQFYGIILTDNKLITLVFLVYLMVVGSLILKWITDKIDEKGIGNGVSMIILTGILLSLPSTLYNVYTIFKVSVFESIFKKEYLISLGIFIVTLAVVVILILIGLNKGKKLKIQNLANREVYKAHYFPIKYWVSSIMPIIFTTTVWTLITLLMRMVNINTGKWLDLTTYRGIGLYALSIGLFTYIYNLIQVDPIEWMQNLNQSGSRIVLEDKVYKKKERELFTKNQEKWFSGKLWRLSSIAAPLLMFVSIIFMLLDKWLPRTIFGTSIVSSGLTGTMLILLISTASELRKQWVSLSLRTEEKGSLFTSRKGK